MTNVAKTFPKLANRHFTRNHALHKIFNRNTLKTRISNIASVIKAHNQKTWSQTTESNQTRSCNCRKPEMCPLDDQCPTDNLVYKATVKTDSKPEKKLYRGYWDDRKHIQNTLQRPESLPQAQKPSKRHPAIQIHRGTRRQWNKLQHPLVYCQAC